jgi:uncharacterized RDD family membrane protein YckC
MKCAACGWPNAASHTTCFNCQAPLHPLPAQAARPTAGPVQVSAAGTVFAPMGARVRATLIDAALMAGMAWVVVLVGMAVVDLRSPDGGRWLAIAVVFFLVVSCLPAFMDAWGEGSVGKRLTGLRVVTGSGERPGVLRSLLRHLFKYGGHLAIPFALRIVEHLVLGPRTLHDAVARTHVVVRDAPAADIVQASATQTRGQVLGTVLAVLVTPFVLLVLGLVGYLLVQMRTPPHDPQRDPQFAAQREAVREIWRAAQPLTILLEHQYHRTGAFAVDADRLVLPPGLGTLSFYPGTGTLVILASQAPIHGARIVLFPGLVQNLGEEKATVKFWFCGSPNLPEAQLPQECDSAVPADG